MGVPVPLLLFWEPSWGWVIAANVLLGINQGLTWSTTIVMKIDLVGPARRGLAMGFNEAAGYLAVAATGMATGWLADTDWDRHVPSGRLRSPRPRPVDRGVANHDHARHEPRTTPQPTRRITGWRSSP
jgi:MFS family permease